MIMQNHFALFDLPENFTIDATALDAAYHAVHNQVHPDKFVNQSDAEKRVAMQWATRANEAYQTLKNPLKRAKYLCELNGVDLQIESNTAMPLAFLMQQMEWREGLQDARTAKDVTALEALDGELSSARKASLTKIAQHIQAGDFVQAGQDIRQLMFLEKFGEEVGFAFESLSD